MNNCFLNDHEEAKARIPAAIRSGAPLVLKSFLSSWYWRLQDAREYGIELVAAIPSHSIRLFAYRHLFQMFVGPHSSIHRSCRFYRPRGIRIGANCVVNRDVLFDGRMGVVVGDNTSISEGVAVFTLEHDPNSSTFGERGAEVRIGPNVFVGARAIILPGITVGEGAVVGAGAVVTRDVEPYSIVAGVPARPIGVRSRTIDYRLDYRKFLG